VTNLHRITGTGFAPCEPTNARYDERLLVGYRWYDANHVAPAFPFGHGLSYTTFSYSELHASAAGVTFTLTNNGTVAGSEVPQLYLQFPPSAGEPPQQLKGFQKVGPLAPGASQQVTIKLSSREFSIWSTAAHGWTPVSGKFGFAIGSSSRDIRLTAIVTMP
jgi:beta-glucosidase